MAGSRTTEFLSVLIAIFGFVLTLILNLFFIYLALASTGRKLEVATNDIEQIVTRIADEVIDEE